MKTSRNLKCKLDRELRKHDVTSSQFSVMNQIETMGNQSAAHEIANILGYDRPTISAIVQRLVKAKIVIKADNPQDKRTQYLSLSQHGLNVLYQIRHIADEVSNDVFTTIDADAQNALIQALEKINIALEDN
ncbi:MarR family winged helix-turn-helix transcriptional regulator [Fusibacter sp. JL298sf-3]